MGYRRSSTPVALRLFTVGILLCLCLVALGCGSSESNSEETRQEREDAREMREERESREVAQELENGDFVHCGRKVYVSDQSICTFAKNVEGAYYVEVVAGQGPAIGFHPPAKKDYQVLCSGTVPHKCTPFKTKPGEIESLKAGVIYFSP